MCCTYKCLCTCSASYFRFNTHSDIYNHPVGCLGNICGRLGAIPCFFCCPNGYELVEAEEKAITLRFGQVEEDTTGIILKEPDLYFVNPYTASLKRLHTGLQVIRGPIQCISTKDLGWIHFEPNISFKIRDDDVSVKNAILKTGNIRQTVEDYIHAELRSYLSTRTKAQAAAFDSNAFIKDRNRYLGKEWGVELASVNLHKFFSM